MSKEFRPILYSNLQQKMGQDFLYIQYYAYYIHLLGLKGWGVEIMNDDCSDCW